MNRLHQLLMELIPAGASKDLTAGRAKTLLATVRPRDVAGRTRRQLAADLIDDVAALDRKIKDIEKRLTEAVTATGTSLTGIVGIGPVTAAVILGEVGDVRRFASRHRFATYTGAAPTEISSGDIVRHRLSRAGNRRLNQPWTRSVNSRSMFAPKSGDGATSGMAPGCSQTGGSSWIVQRRASNTPADPSPLGGHPPQACQVKHAPVRADDLDPGTLRTLRCAAPASSGT